MIKASKPTSPGRRGATYLKTEGISKKSNKKVLKKLSKPVSGRVSRGSGGTMTAEGRRRGAKKRYRMIDFKRNKYDISAEVKSIEYDPNRTCAIACILYKDGEYRYILAPDGLKSGDKVISSEKTDINIGNTMPLKNIPVGTAVHNIEMYPGAGGKFARSAGSSASITAKEGKYINLKMPSGEVRKILSECKATIGQLSNEEWKLVSLGKAGRSYHLGKRPKTRGKARPEGHPLAGSYKRRLGRHPVDKWGNKSKGGKTRNRKKTDKYIVKSRHKKK